MKCIQMNSASLTRTVPSTSSLRATKTFLGAPVASKGARSAPKQSAVTKMGMGFHEDMSDNTPKNGRVILPNQVDDFSSFGGLSAKQLEIMGLAGESFYGKEPVSAELIGAKANYRREIPSMTALETNMAAQGVPAQAPPDLPSLLLNSRICYLGMPLVPAVTELIIAELLFLGYENQEKPVYFYINSSGSQTQNGEAVGFETEAYAILDTMRYVAPEMHTVCVGKAWGNAAMLLASGKKGCRHSLPHSSIMTCPPRLNRTQDCATNIMIKANELESNTQTYVDFLHDFTGKEKEEIYKDVGRTRWFTPEAAKEYGLVDKIVNKIDSSVMEKKDYEQMLAAAQARAGGGYRQ